MCDHANPWTDVLTALRKPNGGAPRKIPAWQLFSSKHPHLVTAEATTSRNISDRNQAAMRLFKNLPEAERNLLEEEAQQRHNQAVENYNSATAGTPSEDPQEQQK